MKFLPSLSPLAMLGLALALAACATPANRRELYNSAYSNGVWHDYERRLDASEETGVAPADMGHAVSGSNPGGNNTGATTVVRGRPTAMPKSSPIAPDATTLPSNAAPAAVPAPTGVPSSPTAPTTPPSDPAAPANPGGNIAVPPADAPAVPPPAPAPTT